MSTALAQDLLRRQQNLDQAKEIMDNISDSKDQPGWFEDRSAATLSMVIDSVDSFSVGLENGNQNETSTNVGCKRKAACIETTSSNSNKQPNVHALQELLSIFLRELQQMLASRQVSKEWATALLLDAARSVLLSNDPQPDS